MKVIGVTFFLVALVSFVLHSNLKRRTEVIEEKVTELTQQKAREINRNQQERQRRIEELLPSGPSMTSPFIEKMRQELEQEEDHTMTDPLDILAKLRELSIDEIKMLQRQLTADYRKSSQAGLGALRQACDLILLEADPLFIIQNEDLRHSSYHPWAEGSISAFQSLVKKDPEAALRYFQEIPLSDLQSNKYPFSKIYTRMMGYLFAHDPEQAIHYFQIQRKGIRNLPYRGSPRQLSSMDQAMPYAELLRSKPWYDPSVSSLLSLASEEAERLEGLEGLARFSEAWAGSDRTEAEKWNFFFSRKSEIRSREEADQLMEFMAQNQQSENTSHLWQLSSNWSGVDRQAASTWIEEQPPGPARDRMIEGILSGLLWADEASADRWIPMIQDDMTKARYLEIIEKREAPYRNQGE